MKAAFFLSSFVRFMLLFGGLAGGWYMAGKRQHFIPQFLQRGFSCHSQGGEDFVWVYRKNQDCFKANIKNIGVEGYFYADSLSATVDDKITALENELSLLVESLRGMDDCQGVDSEKLASLLAHLEIRSRNFRKSFSDAGEQFLKQIIDFICDERIFGGYLERKIAENPSVIAGILSKEFDKLNVPLRLRDALAPGILENLPGSIVGFLPQVIRVFLLQKESLVEQLKASIKAGHIKALDHSLHPEHKVTRLRLLGYRFIRNADGVFPLGDSAVFFCVEGERRFKPYLDGSDILKAVFLPVDCRTILVGEIDVCEFDTLELVSAIASCSQEYFVSAENTESNKVLAELIGSSAHLLSKAEIEGIVDDMVFE